MSETIRMAKKSGKTTRNKKKKLSFAADLMRRLLLMVCAVLAVGIGGLYLFDRFSQQPTETSRKERTNHGGSGYTEAGGETSDNSLYQTLHKGGLKNSSYHLEDYSKNNRSIHRKSGANFDYTPSQRGGTPSTQA